MTINREHGFLAIVLRELDKIFSRFMYIVLLFLVPVFCFVFFATLMPSGLPMNLELGIVDMDNSVVSRKMIRHIDATASNTVMRFTRYEDARDLMQQGKIYGYIVIPENFEKDVSFGRQPKIDFYYNAVFLTAGSISQKNVATMLATLTGAVNLTIRRARGQSVESSMGQIQPIVADVHPIGNPEMNYTVYLANLIIPGILELLILLTTTYAIGEELKNRTSRQWLRMADDNVHKALVAKLLPYFIMFLMMALLCIAIMFGYMHFPLNTSVVWMVIDSVLMIIAAQSMAVLIVGLLPVLRDALSACSLYGVLAFSFSGFTFPIEGMPPFIQGLSCVFPLRFYFRIYQKMALNGCEWYYEWYSFAALIIFMLVPTIIFTRLRNACIKMDYPKG